MKNLILITLIIAGLTSCEKAFMKPNAENTNRAVFKEYATLVKEKYAMLEFKGVNIDHLTDSIGATVTEDLADTSFFKKIGYITTQLRDGHSNLIAYQNDTPIYAAGFNTQKGYDTAFNFQILNENYLGSMTKVLNEKEKDIQEHGPNRFIYGRMPSDNDVAYFRIPSFGVSISDAELETVFGSFQGAKGLIIDVRGNGGGDPSLATKIASYFMTERTYTGYERFKIGPAVADFKDSDSYVEPSSSSNKFLNKVVVLTDRGVYSATTTLCYSMSPLTKVTFMGQRTGGGSGSVADGFLANGYAWSLSTSEFIDHLGRHLDDGIDPDIAVALDMNDTSADEIIVAAIAHLQ